MQASGRNFAFISLFSCIGINSRRIHILRGHFLYGFLKTQKLSFVAIRNGKKSNSKKFKFSSSQSYSSNVELTNEETGTLGFVTFLLGSIWPRLRSRKRGKKVME